VQAVFEIDECVGGPDSHLQFLASHNIASTVKEDFEQLEGLAAQAELRAVFAQLARASIQLKIAETQYARIWCGARHVTLAEVDQSITFLLPEDRVEAGREHLYF
jgi:hypothetical protein